MCTIWGMTRRMTNRSIRRYVLLLRTISHTLPQFSGTSAVNLLCALPFSSLKSNLHSWRNSCCYAELEILLLCSKIQNNDNWTPPPIKPLHPFPTRLVIVSSNRTCPAQRADTHPEDSQTLHATILQPWKDIWNIVCMDIYKWSFLLLPSLFRYQYIYAWFSSTKNKAKTA